MKLDKKSTLKTKGKDKPARKTAKAKSSKKSTSPHERLKLQVTKELGLLEKVKRVGWGGLSAAESGRVGGIMTRILRERKKARQAVTDK